MKRANFAKLVPSPPSDAPPPPAAAVPVQLSLFDVPFRSDGYSNSIELYDAVPKHVCGKLERYSKTGETKKTLLDPIERAFEFKGHSYRVTVSPARIKQKDGTYKDFFPQEKEEMIEAVLRKFAYGDQGCYIEHQAAVRFTLSQLRNELKRTGHTYSLQEIKLGLQVCDQTHILLMSADGKEIIGSNVFETVGLQSRDEWLEKGAKTNCFVRFNLLVTKSIRERTFRQLNYDVYMKLKSPLARWLYNRMSHNWIQASTQNNYTIHLLTIIRDSGSKRYAKLPNQLNKVKQVLKQLSDAGVIQPVDEKKDILQIKEGRKLVDAKITLRAGLSFIRDQKKANKIAMEMRKRLS